MKRIIVLIAMIFMFISSVAFAGGKIQKKGDDTYFELSARYMNSESLDLKTSSSGFTDSKERNNGFGLSGEIGRKFGKNFRMGAEFAYRQAKLSGTVRNTNPVSTPRVTINAHGNPVVADHGATTLTNNGLTKRKTRTYSYNEGGKEIIVTEFAGGGGPTIANREEILNAMPNNRPADTTAQELADIKRIATWNDVGRITKHWEKKTYRTPDGEERTGSKGQTEICVPKGKNKDGTNKTTCSDYYLDHTHEVSTWGASQISLSASVNEDLTHEVTFDGTHDVVVAGFFNPENGDVDFGSRYLATKSIMLNAYYDFDSLGDATFWVGVGAGTTWANLADSAAFSYQLMTGVDFAVTDTTSLVLGYNWFQTADIEMETRDIRGTVTDWKAKVGGHEVKLGVKFWF